MNSGTDVKLSICIPTYNFGEFIGQTLDSVMSQVSDGVEVVVLDGGSTDDTEEVVDSFRARYPQSLRYHRLAERGGIDRDIARTVALARGEFCWLFCSDDLMRPNAVQDVLVNLETGHDLYLCGLTLCTRKMESLMDQPVLDLETDTEFSLGDPRERRAYFELAETTVAFFSFAGSIVIRKAMWDAVPLNEAFVGSCWAHVARIFELIPRGLEVRYLARSLLRKRMDNDSFMDRGLVHRCGITIDGYHELARTFFGQESVEAKAIRRVIVNEYPPWTLLSAKLAVAPAGRPGDIAELDRLAHKAYEDPTPRNRLFRAIYRCTPLVAYRFARFVYRGLRLSPWTRTRKDAS